MKRPASVTTFGILNIVLAVLGLFGLLATIAMFKLGADSNNPVMKIIHDNPTYATWMKFTIPLGLLNCVALFVAGLGLLFLKPWGRRLAIGQAIFAIVFGLVGVALNFIFLVRPMLEQAANQQGPEAAGAMMGGAIGGSVGGCIGVIYPILLLIFMTRPKAVAAFRLAVAPPPPA